MFVIWYNKFFTSNKNHKMILKFATFGVKIKFFSINNLNLLMDSFLFGLLYVEPCWAQENPGFHRRLNFLVDFI